MTAKRKLLLALVSGLMIITALFVLLNIFLFAPIRDSNATLSEAQRQLAILDKKNRLLLDLERTIIEERPQIDIIDSALLNPHQVVIFIETLEAAALKSGVKLIIGSAEIQAGAPVKSNGRSRFSISASGSFANVHRYITLLENVPYYIEIDQAYLSTVENGAVRADITLKILTASSSS